ncbi:hypothetical protein O181_015635 [Austropuccinia psidii MF-1]|uniref:Uncharacterized protein n=1 Tax=Austropuccinia psidii MF-1 TaxID=1389203 RepID=A0A9Q3C4A9_9BASI|nr:hypothetical protein [Austropuccinia psidii MF-1]
MRNHKFLTQLPVELENAVKFRFNQIFTLDDITNTFQDVRKRKDIGKYSPYKGISFREKQPFQAENKYKPREKVAELTKKNSCHNCGSTDHYANSLPKAKKKFYVIKTVPVGEIKAENS